MQTPSIVTRDDNTDRAALKAADEVLGYCAVVAIVASKETLPLIKEAQRRIRRRTNPDLFDADGRYLPKGPYVDRDSA